MSDPITLRQLVEHHRALARVKIEPPDDGRTWRLVPPENAGFHERACHCLEQLCAALPRNRDVYEEAIENALEERARISWRRPSEEPKSNLNPRAKAR